jgi:hypothetical protein
MTTSEDHNKYLAYAHLGYGAFQLFMAFAISFFLYFIFSVMDGTGPRGDAPPMSLIAMVIAFTLFFQLLFSVPSIIAGFGLLKRKNWAKTASIIAGVLSAMSFPLGTAVCVYTFWFLFSDSGKELYARPLVETGNRADYFLNEPRDEGLRGEWTERRPKEYVPPKEMPNWRD